MSKYSQISFEEGFIKNLLNKLKVGNRRGIHLNALPGRLAARLDIKEFDKISPDLSADFLNDLLTKEQFRFEVNFENVRMSLLDEKEKSKLHLLAKRLNSIAYEDRDQFLEFGIKNFAFGYPLLIRRDVADPSKIIKAPLLIWSLNIEKSARKNSSWVISRDENSPVIVNELLRAHISNDSRIELNRLSEDFLDDNVIDKEELTKICSEILSQLGTKESVAESQVVIESCPSRDKIENLATDIPWIQWSGVLGIYKSRKESIIQRNEELLKDLPSLQDQKLILDRFQTSTVSGVATDPSKEEIINTLMDSEIKLIQGPPGTGKSQALTAILTNVLESGGKALVVCEKKTALDVIYKNLEKLGLSNYCAVIDDVNRDRRALIKKAREKMDAPMRWQNSGHSDEYYSKFERFKMLRDKFNKNRQDLVGMALGNKSWKDAIGLFLSSNKEQSYKILHDKSLVYSDLSFTKQEFDLLTLSIIESDRLYNAFDLTNIKTLQRIDRQLFSKPYSRIIFDDLTRSLDGDSQLLADLKSLILALEKDDVSIDKYNIFDMESLLLGLSKLKDVRNVLLDADFLISGCQAHANISDKTKIGVNFIDKLLGVFSKKQDILNHKRKDCQLVIAKFNDESKEHIGLIKLIDITENTSIKNLASDIENSVQTIESHISKFQEIIDLKEQIDKFEQDLNTESDIELEYLKPSLNLSGSIDMFKVSVAQSLELLEECHKEMKDYEPYHKWFNYLHNSNSVQKKIIVALSETGLQKWSQVFTSWYLYGLLSSGESNGHGGLTAENRALEEMQKLFNQLKIDQIEEIKLHWDKKMQEKSAEYDTQQGGVNILYNLARNRRFERANSLRKIVHSDFDLFTSLFPIILTNPIAADSILPLTPGLFSVVIFDEASQLRIEDTFTSLIRGQYKIIAGDKHQMPPSNYFHKSGALEVEDSDTDQDDMERLTSIDINRELASTESLLDYAEALPKSIRNYSYLNYHYRSNHPALIEFSNAAFYGGNLITLPPSKNYSPISFVQVDGIYHENINLEEIEAVISILKEKIHIKSDGSYPSVGIGTFNIKQRNSILDRLDEEAVEDRKFGEVLQGIKKAGFFVKNLENIQGDEMDCMILSTTFGPNDEGRFFERFGPLTHEKSYRLLNVLITRAKNQLYVCTSIPKEKYLSYDSDLQKLGNHKKAILYAYLAYAYFVSNNDTEGVQSVLDNLMQNTHDTPRTDIVDQGGLVESPFEQEVYEVLIEKFGSENIEPQYKVGGFRIDFVINTSQGVKIALECDGKTFHASNEAYAHDMYRQEELEKMGFIVYRIWSPDWWNNYQAEISKLVEFVQTQDALKAPIVSDTEKEMAPVL